MEAWNSPQSVSGIQRLSSSNNRTNSTDVIERGERTTSESQQRLDAKSKGPRPEMFPVIEHVGRGSETGRVYEVKMFPAILEIY